jgi:hypothetical protein
MLFSGQNTGRSSSTMTQSVAGGTAASKDRAAKAAVPPLFADCKCCTASSTYMHGKRVSDGLLRLHMSRASYKCSAPKVFGAVPAGGAKKRTLPTIVE